MQDPSNSFNHQIFSRWFGGLLWETTFTIVIEAVLIWPQDRSSNNSIVEDSVQCEKRERQTSTVNLYSKTLHSSSVPEEYLLPSTQKAVQIVLSSFLLSWFDETTSGLGKIHQVSYSRHTRSNLTLTGLRYFPRCLSPFKIILVITTNTHSLPSIHPLVKY